MLQSRIHTWLPFLFIACLGCAIVGCKKDPDNKPPVISQIRAITPAPNDSVLTSAGPGQHIVIQGANLATTQAIIFNGYPAAFNSALFSDNNLPVTIPADMPFATLPQDELNTIRVITEHGEVVYQFPIVPPPPVISTASNEYALEGERITITGNNFFFVDKVVFPGGIEVTTGITTNDPGTTLEVTVPPGITTGGPLQVVNRYGTGTSVLLFNDLATGMLCNFDDVNTLNNWAGVGISSSSADFPGNRGTYARMTYNNVGAGDGTWWGGGRSINCEVPLPWVPVDDLDQPMDSYALKFELNTKEPWKGGVILLDKDYGWSYLGRVEPWKTAAGGTYTTNGWKTIVVPLSNFKNDNGNGVAAANLIALLGADGNGGVNFYFINDGTTPIELFDAAVDNIRVVRVK